MTTWDVVGFIGMGLISIIMALIGFIIAGLKERLNAQTSKSDDLEKQLTHLKIDLTDRLHRDEWERYKESQDDRFERIFDKLEEIKDMIHTKQDKTT